MFVCFINLHVFQIVFIALILAPYQSIFCTNYSEKITEDLYNVYENIN